MRFPSVVKPAGICYYRAMSKANAEQIKQILRSAGQRATETRVEILKAFQVAKKPLSMEDVYKKVSAKKGDQSTVYRTVNSLVTQKILRPVDLRHGHAHYELNDSDHHHLVCVKCGKISKFTGCDLDDLKKSALKQSKDFKEIQDHAIELFGICKKCAK